MSDGLKRARGAAMQSRLPVEVRVGSVWADNDPRSAGRTLRVERVDGDKAVCTVLTNTAATEQTLRDWARPPGAARDTPAPTPATCAARPPASPCPGSGRTGPATDWWRSER